MKRRRNVSRFIVIGGSVLKILCRREGVSSRFRAVHGRAGMTVEDDARGLTGLQVYDRSQEKCQTRLSSFWLERESF